MRDKDKKVCCGVCGSCNIYYDTYTEATGCLDCGSFEGDSKGIVFYTGTACAKEQQQARDKMLKNSMRRL